MHNGGRSTKTYSLCNFFRHRVTSFYKHSSCHNAYCSSKGIRQEENTVSTSVGRNMNRREDGISCLVSIAKMFPMALIHSPLIWFIPDENGKLCLGGNSLSDILGVFYSWNIKTFWRGQYHMNYQKWDMLVWNQ